MITKTTLKNGEVQTRNENGLLHSENDEPSVVRTLTYGKIEIWHKNGKRHRENNKPAYRYREFQREDSDSGSYWLEGKCIKNIENKKEVPIMKLGPFVEH